MSVHCSCKCGLVKFVLPEKPTEIAKCFCSICRRLNKQYFTPFAKYNVKLLKDIDSRHIDICRSSNRARRGFCSSCRSPLFMLYDHSRNVWIVASTFDCDWADIESYDIHKS